MDELQELLREKREIERRIKALTTGSVCTDMAKLDRITAPAKFQKGKWALYYKYVHTANIGNWEHSRAVDRVKWQPMLNGDSFEDVLNRIPDVINELTELYEKAKGEEHGTDT